MAGQHQTELQVGCPDNLPVSNVACSDTLPSTVAWLSSVCLGCEWESGGKPVSGSSLGVLVH
jgi:hypothetical protein